MANTDEIINKILSNEKLVRFLDDNDFKSLYELIRFKNVLYPDEIHLFTEALLNCGIDPLKYMDYVPRGYLDGTNEIRSIEIPDNIVAIRDNAFFESSIQDVKFGSNLKEIDPYAFYGCNDLAIVDLSHTNIETIEYGAFGSSDYSCKLSKIILPNTIEKIGAIHVYSKGEDHRSFSIEYLGTAEQWKYVDHPKKHNKSIIYDVYIKG